MFQHGLSAEELAAQEAIELPEREMMQDISITAEYVNWSLVGALNAAVAAQQTVEDAEANATAEQNITVEQSQ